ncbi:MAG: histidinol-phosphate transaminase [Planctomycetota bacterium]|nr:histidinol-phosphate transaminase [Planctomycetota bacterium]
MLSLRPAIRAMSAYVPGEKAGGDDFIVLNANENPYPPSPQVFAAINAALNRLAWYPESSSRDARDAAAAVFKVAPETVLLTNSSDEMLRIIAQACLNDGDRAVAFTPSFTFYRTLCQVQNADFREIAFPDDFSLPPLPADLAAAKVIFFPNPGAPSGTVYELADIEKLLTAAPDAVVVIDEAYADFDRNAHSALPLLGKYNNLIVTRTLSKSYSLAGLRVGLGFAAPELATELHKVRDYYNLDQLAQAAAAAALRDQNYLRENCEKIIATRERFAAALAATAKVWASGANFVLARFGKPAAANLYQYLKDRKILTRYWNAPRLDDCLRITIGTDEQMRATLAAIKAFLSEQWAVSSGQ